jgi:agmatinase
MWDPLPAQGQSATLLGAPAATDFSGVEIALVGVPFDLGTTHHPGARLGPSAVRSIQEGVGPLHHRTQVNPFALCRIADVGDVDIRAFDLRTGLSKIEAYYTSLCAAGVTPLSVGGDHSISYPILKALGKDRPVGLVHIDAHCDTMGAIAGEQFHHGSPFLNATLDGVLDPERTIQIGIRGGAEVFWEFSYESGMTVVHIEDVEEWGMSRLIERIRAVVGTGPTYLSLDIDALDPAFAPGTGTPEVGGLSPREVSAILRGLRGLDIIGGDLVEISPDQDSSGRTAHVGKQLLFESLCLVAESRARRSGGGASPPEGNP